MTQLHYHLPSEDRDACLYDHETWPCTVQQIRSQVADEIDKEVEKHSSYGPDWVAGAQDASAVARGPHN